jgi:predicted transcriptional regulator
MSEPITVKVNPVADTFSGKTIKQIADELGVDKQRVYRYIKKNRINEAHHEHGVMWYDETVESLIKQHFSGNDVHHEPHHDVHHITSNDTVIDTVITMLKQELEVKNQELEIKNEQIRELNARLSESHAALIASQQSAQAAQALHAGTLQAQLGNGSEPRKSLWSRIRKK